jgi:subtilisin family serine protease
MNSKSASILSFTFLVLTTVASGQADRYIVFFKDKPAAGSAGKQADWYDRPVDPGTLSGLSERGRVLEVSKWLNACVYEGPRPDGLASVVRIEQVADRAHAKFPANLPAMGFAKKPDASYYGLGLDVAQSLNISCLHDRGLRGSGIRMAFLDAGYVGLDTIGLFEKLRDENRILYTHNFWSNSADVYDMTSHGMSCAGEVIAFEPNTYVGVAPDVSVMLFTTDHALTETRLDEFYYVRALEVADSLGAQIISASLSYSDFDDPAESYAYADMNGHTALSTTGVDIAASKGMLVVGSAGNGGRLCAPCDADSILCVGGAFIDGSYDQISSFGPSADGRIKPDVATMTRNIYGINANGAITMFQYGGTSSACPQVAGLAALLKEGHPHSSNMQIIEAIKRSGRKANAPDTLGGHGIPDGCKADSILSLIDGMADEYAETASLSIYPNPAGEIVKVRTDARHPISNITVLTVEGKVVSDVRDVNSSFFSLDVSLLAEGIYIVGCKLSDGSTRSVRLVK